MTDPRTNPTLTDVNQLDELLRQCIQCGLCLPHCATWLATGNEVQSPRGRLLLLGELIRASHTNTDTAAVPDAFLQAFDQCIGCRACDAWPSGSGRRPASDGSTGLPGVHFTGGGPGSRCVDRGFGQDMAAETGQGAGGGRPTGPSFGVVAHGPPVGRGTGQDAGWPLRPGNTTGPGITVWFRFSCPWE